MHINNMLHKIDWKRGFVLNGMEILRHAVKALDDKKAIDLKAIEVTEVTVLADYFAIATATSSTHVRALAEAVEEALSNKGVEPHHIEGRATGWILLDYGTTVVHVMDSKAREFYGLEHTWNDGKELDINELL